MFDFDGRDDEPCMLILDPNTGAMVSVSGGHDDDH